MTFLERVNNGEVISNMDLTDKENKKIAFNLLQNKQESISEHVGKRFSFTAYLITKAIFNDEDPEAQKKKEGVKICLKTDYGAWYSTSSMAVLNGLETWEHMFGVMSDGNPMEAAVKEVQSGNNSKFKYINLEL